MGKWAFWLKKRKEKKPSRWRERGEEVASLIAVNLLEVLHWLLNVMMEETALKSCSSRMISDRKSPREK